MRLAAMIPFLVLCGAAMAEPVNIRPDISEVVVPTEDGPVTIGRIQDNEHEVSGEWARTSRACPPFCIQPMEPVAGVKAIGELELLDMLAVSQITVIDSRTRDWFEKGTIPGGVNIPYTDILDQLGNLG